MVQCAPSLELEKGCLTAELMCDKKQDTAAAAAAPKSAQRYFVVKAT